MGLWRYSVLWYLGGMAYTGMELLWRGWSHSSMFAAGGTCFLLIGHLGELEKPLPLAWRSLAGAGIVTTVELAAGQPELPGLELQRHARQLPGSDLPALHPLVGPCEPGSHLGL